ncbi:MAG: NUDIX hydrolase [Deltaproteobacteria bacterium]|nr:NUDIX hydrolase [Deltaproteobacteria bacterium]
MGRGGKEIPSWPLAHAVEVVQDVSNLSSPVEGYLRRHRHRVKTVFADGSRSELYVVDYIDREPRRRDAVAIAVYARSSTGEIADTRILLRRQVRYAAWVRARRPLTTELIAGLIEDGEPPEATAVRELWEEAGLSTEVSRVRRLGRDFFILPGIFTERIVPLAVETSLAELERASSDLPAGDGSPFEEGAMQLVVTLGEAFELIDADAPADPRALTIDDAKTELTLARLWRVLEGEAR